VLAAGEETDIAARTSSHAMRLDGVTASQCEPVPRASRESYLRDPLVPRFHPEP
jgi:hypothetical protein